jgi:RNA polymerase sigma-70 factor (ECF subfamily)
LNDSNSLSKRHSVSYLYKRYFVGLLTIEIQNFSAIISHFDTENRSFMQGEAGDITRLLASWRAGDHTAMDRLLHLLQRELKRIARRHLARERKDHTMQPSSLVQEAFLRLLPGRDLEWQDRVHFFRAASCVMRHVLVDHARRHRRAKRGNRAVHIPIDGDTILSPDQVEEVVAIDLALQRLAALDERKSNVLEMRLFGGLSIEETAAALGIAPNTVLRDWNFARAWLRRELSGERLAKGEPREAD